MVMTLWLCVNLSGCQIQGMFASQPVVYETVAIAEVPDRSSEFAVEVEDRGWADRVVYYQKGGLAHHSLYLEDPYEGKGSNDGVFETWGKDDAAAATAGPVWFLVNVLFLPVELLKRLPWQEQESRSILAVEGPVYEFGSLPSGDIRDSGYPEN